MWNEEIREKLRNKILPELEKEVWGLNDDMAAHPELGSHEFESSRKIVELLRAHGIEVEYPFCGLETAFRAVINPGGKKKAAFLAEYDALPEIGHGCGHCASGMASVMAALAVQQVRDSLGDVEIDVIGTPDEELGGGKVLLQKAGAFDNYDFAAMVHMNATDIAEVRFWAIDGMQFIFHGAPAHAAACPEKGRNALNATRLLFDSTDMMRQHVIKDAVISGYIAEGGKASNIVPDLAQANFVTRAPRRDQLDDITAWVKDCARAAAMATRTEVEILPDGVDYDGFLPVKSEIKLLEECFAAIGRPLPEDAGILNGGSSDIGNVTPSCVAFHPMMGIGQGLVAHTREFAEAMTCDVTHKAITDSAALLLELTWRLFTDDALLEKIKKDHFDALHA